MNLRSQWLKSLWNKNYKTSQRGRRSSTGRRQVPVEVLEAKQLLVGDIAGTLLNDANGNAVKDPGESGLANWTVYLDLNQNGGLDAGEPTEQTNVDGDYLFADLDDGDYDVREVLPTGWSSSPGTPDVITATVFDGNEFKADFYNTIAQVGSITGTVWNDWNGDGLRAATDSGLSGWTIFIDSNNNSIVDSGELTTTTDANGNYAFGAVQEGEHKVREILPAGWQATLGYDTNQSVFVTTGNETVLDFANLTPEAGSVSGVIFDDVDGNGVRATDPSTGAFTEPGLAGWEVFVDLNGDGVLSTGEPTATSDSNGAYTLFGVPYGTSTIQEVTHPDFTPTAPVAGSYVIDLLNGQTVEGFIFGNHERRDASISGTIFADANHDGLRNATERGLAGITVYLDLNNNGSLDASEPSVVTSTDLYYTPSIDEAGSYSFTHIAKGSYSVRQIVPEILSATPASEFSHSVTIVGVEAHPGVNFADVYRPAEIHGVKFDDSNGNHQQDNGEAGVAGVTVYIDLDRDNTHDTAEPSRVTATDGTYSFSNLTPGAYVVRQVETSGSTQTYPNTTGGILWPSGTSHAAVGNVTPKAIQAALATGETHRQTVSLTLPNTGALTNMVDVFLLFDDTGSFTDNSPIVRSAFPEIISSLQTALPGIDLGFGVGRFEEYANYASEDPSGRPFILNQPIVASATTGFATAIQSALDRTAPGYGGDTPETDIEALYQLVTGAGFDGNNNGTTTDSGATGLVSTQLTPGDSGDVPSFASFTVDASGNVLAAAGTIGGAGFRAGALPIILTATDTGFAFQPKGETNIVGVGGLTLPLTDLTQTSRNDTPFNSGAGIQETITGLNALGALVIGLGTNPEATVDPRQDLEALAKLTGATNQSTTTIDNGTADPIAPGDPLYFQIASGFSASVANGITTAIQNAVTNVAVNVTVRASDPRVQIINHTGALNSLKAGDTATFDIEFVGDGIPHRFDLQFVRAGTNVVLGSIPVVLGTPIPGDGYSFEELDDGEIDNSVNFGAQAAIVVTPNAAPSFVAGANQTVLEDAGPQSVTWATSISSGPASEASQTVDFIVTTDNPSLFEVAPVISANGTLTYTPAANANGSATVTVKLHDNGGTANGGIDTSASQTFLITVTPVNDAPVAHNDSYMTTAGSTLTIAASGLLTNDTDVDDSNLTASLAAAPLHGKLSLNTDGSFAYTPDSGFLGTDSFAYKANDGRIDSNVANVSLLVTASVVYQQTPSMAGSVVYSSWLAPDGFDGDVFVYDNFTVPSDFSLNSIDWSGSSAPSVAAGNTAFTVAIYDSLPGGSQPHITALPNMDPNGALVTYRLAAGDFTVTPGSNGLFNYHFQLPTEFTAPKGTYWIQIEGWDGAWQWAVSNNGDHRDFKYFVGGPYFLRGSEDVAFTLNGAASTVNQAPVANNGILTTDEDAAGTGTLSATDVDSAALNYILVDTTNAHGAVTITNSATGAYSFTPDANYNGSASFTFKANDGTLDSNVATVSITVKAVNDAPIANSGSLTTDEDTATTGTLLVTDIDSATLAYSLVDTTKAHGTVTITNATTGAYNYTPDANYNGAASFTFKANDGSLDSNISTVSITVNSVNDAPVASNGSLTTNEDTTATGTLTASDIDSASLTYSLVDTSTAHGNITITNAATGAFSYTPNANFNGVASFSFKANDGSLDSNVGTVSITVNSVNDAPLATNGTLTTDEDVAATGTLSASDIDSASLTYGLVDTSIAHGTVTITNAATGAFTYTPNANFNGVASFSFKANDGSLNSNVATVNITVNSVNDAPVASNSSVTVANNSSVTGTLAAADLDSSSLTYRLLSTANSHGVVTLTNAVTGTFSYTPAASYSGTASFTFVANDGTLDSNVGTVAINVTPGATSDLVYTATGTTLMTVTVVSGKLKVTIGSTVMPDVDPATVRSITLNGAGGKDSINLTGLSPALYSHLAAVTINGGDNDDTIVGSFIGDVIDGGAGRDSINGRNGNDTLLGGAGNDTLFGRAGDDLLDGGLGNDVLSGGEDDDDLHGGAGLDSLDGGNGNDCLHGDGGDDQLLGGDGNDTLRGSAGNDMLDAGLGDDLLLGESGNDTALGGLGNDIILGGAGDDSLNGNGTGTDSLYGNDTIFGGTGRDTLKGGNGNDILSGEGDNDILIGEADIDSLFGGAGTDTLQSGESNSADGVFIDAAFNLRLDELLARCP